jgi:hypothetical protein
MAKSKPSKDNSRKTTFGKRKEGYAFKFANKNSRKTKPYKGQGR